MNNVVPLRQSSPAAPELSDEAVALACAAGDSAAVAELFDRFRHAWPGNRGRPALNRKRTSWLQ